MAYGEAAIRTRIETVVKSVPNVGQVHNRERHMADWNRLLELMKATIGGTDQVRGWMITCDGFRQELVGFEGSGITDTIAVTYTHKVRGWMAMNDAGSSETGFMALVMAVCAALEADTQLQSRRLAKETPVVSVTTVGYAMFTNILCHYAEITLNPTEVV